MDSSGEVGGVGAEAGPRIVFGFEDQAASYGIAVEIAEFLDALFL